jgi:hypothetical protein
VLRPRRSRGDISKSLSTSADTEPHENRPPSSPRRNYAHTGDPYGGFSDSDVPRRPLKCRFPELYRTPAPPPHGCTCAPEILRRLWCMYHSEAAEGLDLLPKFDWEVDNGEYSPRDPLWVSLSGLSWWVCCVYLSCRFTSSVYLSDVASMLFLRSSLYASVIAPYNITSLNPLISFNGSRTPCTSSVLLTSLSLFLPTNLFSPSGTPSLPFCNLIVSLLNPSSPSAFFNALTNFSTCNFNPYTNPLPPTLNLIIPVYSSTTSTVTTTFLTNPKYLPLTNCKKSNAHDGAKPLANTHRKRN